MITSHLILLICLYHSTITSSNGWRPFVVEFTNISTYSLVNYVEINSSISASGAISVYVNALQDISNIYAKTVIKLETSDKVYDLEFINKTVNVCEFFENRKYEPILQILYKILNKARTFPNRCPIRNKYLLENILVNAEDLPPIMPSNKNLVELFMMNKSGNRFKVIFGIVINYQVRQLY